jgi:5'(3')-deoxyribonucleotidase
MVDPHPRSAIYSRFLDAVFIVVITVGVVNSIGLFSGPASPRLAMVLVAIIFIALSYVYYNLSIHDDPYDGSRTSWARFSLDATVAFTYIGLFLTLSNYFYFGLLLAAIYILYGIHGFTTVAQVGWFRYDQTTLRPSSLPAYWFFWAPIFGATGWLLQGYKSSGTWLDYVPPAILLLEILLTRWLRHYPKGGTVKVLQLIRVERRPVVAVDIDGVLADQVDHVLAKANREMHLSMTRDQIVAWNTPVGGVGFAQLIESYLKDPAFVRTMPEIPGASTAVRALSDRAIIKIASSRPRETEPETKQWVRSHLGWDPEFINTLGTQKGDVDADVLIDDGDHNIASFVSKPRHIGVLMIRPWNNGPEVKGVPRVEESLYRARDWNDVLALFGIGPPPS